MKKETLKNNFIGKRPLSSKEKGSLLYFAVIVCSLLLAISFGLGTVLIMQLKGLKEIGNSTVALFGADTGMEYILYLDAICQKPENCTTTSPYYNLCYPQAQLRSTTTCIGLVNYTTSSRPNEFNIPNLSYEARAATTTVDGVPTTIFRSRGTYRETQRAIEASRPIR